MRLKNKKLLFTLGICSIGILFGILKGLSLPSFSSVRVLHQSSDLIVLDREGVRLQSLRSDFTRRSFLWVSLSEMSPSLVRQLLAVEDKRFFSHFGVDPIAVFGSLKSYSEGAQLRGASTITMQLLKILEPHNRTQSFNGKVQQVWGALVLERVWSKEEILEAYLNLVSFKGEIQGIEAASELIFGKRPSGLTDLESLLLVSRLQSPNMNQDSWIKRACLLKPTRCQSLAEISRGGDFPREHLADEFSSFLKKNGERGVVSSSLLAPLQEYVRDIINEQIRLLKDENVSEAAALVLDNRTGEILAYIGNRGVQSKNSYVDGVQALRQAGSTLKPFLYGLSFEKGILTPDSWIEDSPLEIAFDRGVYKPKNHDHQFKGWVQVKEALASSLNVPAVKVMGLLGEEALFQRMEELGFRKLVSSEFYGPALALGVADISLFDLTNAYRVLANDGLYSEVSYKPQSTAKFKNVFATKASREITSILSNNSHRSLSFGLNSILAGMDASVKTGTSKDMRDNWCVGYNNRFTVGVWVGNFDGAPMRNVVGTTGAAPIWHKTMAWLSKRFPEEQSISKVSFEEQTLADTQPLQLVYPTKGMIIALDPEIPDEQQRVPLIFSGKNSDDVYWRINQNERIYALGKVLWRPTLGKHKIELMNKDRVVESIEVIVR